MIKEGVKIKKKKIFFENCFWCSFQYLSEQERPSLKHFFLLILDYGQGSIKQKAHGSQPRGYKTSGIHEPGAWPYWKVQSDEFNFCEGFFTLHCGTQHSLGVFLHFSHITATESYPSVGSKEIQRICTQSAFKHGGRWVEIRRASFGGHFTRWGLPQHPNQEGIVVVDR